MLPRLRDITGESVQLYRRDGAQRVCVAAAEPASGLRDTVPVGSRLPMTAGSGRQGARRVVRARRAALAAGRRAGSTSARSSTCAAGGGRRAWPSGSPGWPACRRRCATRGGNVVAAVSVSGPDRPHRAAARRAVGGRPAGRGRGPAPSALTTERATVKSRPPSRSLLPTGGREDERGVGLPVGHRCGHHPHRCRDVPHRRLAQRLRDRQPRRPVQRRAVRAVRGRRRRRRSSARPPSGAPPASPTASCGSSSGGSATRPRSS